MINKQMQEKEKKTRIKVGLQHIFRPKGAEVRSHVCAASTTLIARHDLTLGADGETVRQVLAD